MTWVSKCFTPRNYNPRDIIRNCRRLLKKESLEPMLPWYRGFRGNIAQIPEQEGRFEPLGSFVETGDDRWLVSKLQNATNMFSILSRAINDTSSQENSIEIHIIPGVSSIHGLSENMIPRIE